MQWVRVVLIIIALFIYLAVFPLIKNQFRFYIERQQAIIQQLAGNDS